MYEQIFKRVTLYDLGPLSQTATPRTPPLERDVLYGRPPMHEVK